MITPKEVVLMGKYTKEPWFKLNFRIFDSSIWEEDVITRIVWITLLGLAQNLHNKAHGPGVVIITPGNLARKALVSREQLDAAIAKLIQPDPYSRTNAGQPRLEVLENGYRIPSFDLYHDPGHYEEVIEKRREAGKRRAAEAVRVNGKFAPAEEAE